MTLAGWATAAQAQEQAVEEEAVEEVIVQATRTGRRVQDEPIRVVVLNREEIEEKITMRPGNIAMLLSETGGPRVQVTSPALDAWGPTEGFVANGGIRVRFSAFKMATKNTENTESPAAAQPPWRPSVFSVSVRGSLLLSCLRRRYAATAFCDRAAFA